MAGSGPLHKIAISAFRVVHWACEHNFIIASPLNPPYISKCSSSFTLLLGASLSLQSLGGRQKAERGTNTCLVSREYRVRPREIARRNVVLRPPAIIRVHGKARKGGQGEQLLTAHGGSHILLQYYTR